MKRLSFIAVLALGLTAPTLGPLAHHGWSWTTGGNIDLTGIITSVRLGNPHGVLKVDVEGREPDVIQPFLRDAPRGLWPRHLIVELKAGGRDWERSAELEAWLVGRSYRLEQRTRLNGLFRLT